MSPLQQAWLTQAGFVLISTEAALPSSCRASSLQLSGNSLSPKWLLRKFLQKSNEKGQADAGLLKELFQIES